MDTNAENRTRRIMVRLTPKEYKRLEDKWKKSTCLKLSEYLRDVLFEKPVTTFYRDRSRDDLLNEFVKLGTELNRIGNNYNQSVKRLHTLHHIPEFKDWMMASKLEQMTLVRKMDEIKNHVKKIVEVWLQ